MSKKILLLTLSLLLVAGCGWRLRGTLVLPEDLRSVRVINQADNTSLSSDLAQLLTNNDVNVVDSVDRAQLIITIIENDSQRRTATLGANARVTEYELSAEALYSITDTEGQELLPPTRANVIRSYRYDENDVVGAAGEQRLLEQEMRRELAQQILRRLRFLEFKQG